MSKRINMLGLISAFLFFGCNSAEIPAVHKGRMFDKTGILAFYTGGDGFTGPILTSGTVFTGVYDEVKMVECSEVTRKESLNSLTKDSIQFTVDAYVRSQPNCSDKSVEWVLNNISPSKKEEVVTSEQLYLTYISPALHSAMRETVSRQTASDMNTNREEVSKHFEEKFKSLLNGDGTKPVVITVSEVSISNFDFPKEMKEANTQLALQATLTKLAIANREKIEQETKTEQAKIQAQTETEKLKIKLEEAYSEAQSVNMKYIAKTIRENPEYLKYDLQQKMPEIYKALGANGNLVVIDPDQGAGFFMKLLQQNGKK